MRTHPYKSNSRKIIEAIEKREGKPILELISIHNERMEAKEKANQNIRFSFHQPQRKRQKGCCHCGALYKRILVKDDFLVLCRRSNKAPRNCYF